MVEFSQQISRKWAAYAERQVDDASQQTLLARLHVEGFGQFQQQSRNSTSLQVLQEVRKQ